MISVIVLGLKSDSYLTRCLNSLKRQVFKDFEVVLVSSSEYESDVEYGYSISRINSNNVSESINEGLTLIHGEVVLFCTSASVFAPNALDNLNNSFQNKQNTCVIFDYYRENEKSFGLEEGSLLSIYHKAYRTDIIKANRINIKKGKTFAEEAFLIDYISHCETVTKLEDAFIYEMSDSSFDISDTIETIDKNEWLEITENIQKLPESITPLVVEGLSEKIKLCPFIPEEMVWITEEKLHRYYAIQYAVISRNVMEWWNEVRDNKDVESYDKLKHLLEKYDDEQDFQEVLLNDCGLCIEQYKYIKEYDLHNALFFADKTTVSDPEKRCIEGNYDQIAKSIGAVRASQSLLEKALGVDAINGSAEQRSILNGEQEGLVKVGAVWYYYKNGAVDLWYNGLAKNEYGWFYVRRGVVDRSYYGIATNRYGEWVVTEGTIDKSVNGYHLIGEREVFVTKGKIDITKNGMIPSNNTLKFYKKGEVDTTANGLIQYDGKWYYVEHGTVNYSFKGLVSYGDKWWYIENGTINAAFEGYAKNKDGWHYVKAGTICDQQPPQPTQVIVQEQIRENNSDSKEELSGAELANYAVGKYASGELGLKTIFKSFGAWIKYKF